MILRWICLVIPIYGNWFKSVILREEEEGVMCSLKTKQVFVLLLWFVFSEDVYFILNFKLH